MDDTGLLGEQLASRYLRRKGFKILEKNFSTRIGEIDIIAMRQNLLVFCEVKTRLNKEFGEPFEAVTLYKQNRLRRLAEYYLLKHQKYFEEIRFDVISILLEEGDLMKIEHIENAF